MEGLKLDERILSGINLGESHFREFKSAWLRNHGSTMAPRPLKDICRDIGEVLVAFANADGGELFVGVEDDGKITGIPHKTELLDAMGNAYVNYIHSDTPLPKPSQKIIDINDNKVLYFQISKSTESFAHLTSEGRCLQRFDRENRPVSAERIQMDRLEKSSLEYDRQFILNASINDLDLEEITGIIDHLDLGYTPEKFLQIFDLAEYSDELRLRKAALLLFSKNIVKWHPRCAIRIIRIRSTEFGIGHDYVMEHDEDETISENIVTILERAWESLKPHLARIKFQENALFREKIIYPEEACREALINAIAHRDYSIEGKAIEILIYDDRMEVRSPGRLLSSISLKDLKELKGTHQSRNVFIARVLRELGYMREMGEGIRRIYSSIRASDLVEPEICSDQNSFTVTLFHKSIFSERDLQWLDSFSEFLLSKEEQRIVLLGRNGDLLSTNDITKTLEIVDTKDFTKIYNKLNEKGIIFNARPGRHHQRRSMPRFQIRPPHEAQQYLQELEKALFKIGPFEKFDSRVEAELRSYLSPNSPYLYHPLWSLRAMQYISEISTPLPRASSIWLPSLRLPVISKESLEDDGKLANVTWLENTYGFMKDEYGEIFFFHRNDLKEKDNWSLIQVGSRIKFKIGERNIPGKYRNAKSIELLY